MVHWAALGMALQAGEMGPLAVSLDTTNHLSVVNYQTIEAGVKANPVDKKEGQGAVQVDFTAAAQQAGSAGVEIEIPLRNLKGKTLAFWVKNLTPESCGSLFVAFFDQAGRRAEMRAWHGARDWMRLVIPVGNKGLWHHFEAEAEADITQIVKIRFYANSREPSQTVSVLWDDLKEVTDPTIEMLQ
ncbi:MAG: hypothetical protein HY360_15360 [Verrucomicrobia bacterium]|nr:hypothetical protein [Verrucomicrobiota bacterium]